jgi:hypothetical protein
MDYPRKIAILLHGKDRPRPHPSYLAVALSEQWREMGIEVEFARGVRRPLDADLVLPHVDLTVLPRPYVRFLERHPRVVNRFVTDISKRYISSLRVRPGDDYGGPVIVKTDRNAGGRPEKRLLGRPWVMRWPIKQLARRFAKPNSGFGFHAWTGLELGDYPVFDSVRSLPSGTFWNPRLVVERFAPEREGRLFCLRTYFFAGEGEVNLLIKGRSPVVKSDRVVERVELPPPEAIRALRRRLRFDYGKFDYVIHDGEPLLFDANRTPTFGRGSGYSEYQLEIARRLARGLLAAFDRGER